MRRIVCLVEIVHMAPLTRSGSVAVIVVMTGIAGKGNMRAGNNIVIIMVREQGRLPVRICRMAGGAICGQPQGGMVGVGGLVVITLVTSIAGIRCIRVTRRVAAGAANGHVSPGKGIDNVMVWETCGFPVGIRSMAVSACCWNPSSSVIRVGSLVVSVDVAIGAGGRSAGVSTHMTAVAAGRGMSPGQWEIVVMIRKGRRFPSGIGGMTCGTCGGEADCTVVGIRGLVIGWHMAVGT